MLEQSNIRPDFVEEVLDDVQVQLQKARQSILWQDWASKPRELSQSRTTGEATLVTALS